MNIILITKEVLFMDDWNKFPGNEEKVTETPVNFTTPESTEKPEKKKKPKSKYVTKKFFIFSLVFTMLFSAAVGAGAFAFPPHCSATRHKATATHLTQPTTI